MRLQDKLVEAAKEAMKSYVGPEAQFPDRLYDVWCVRKDVHVSCGRKEHMDAAITALQNSGWKVWATTPSYSRFGQLTGFNTPFSPPDKLLQNLQSEVNRA